MKLLATLSLLLVVSLPVLAGDLPFPPAPPCKDNCGASQPVKDASLKTKAILLIVRLLA